MKVIGSELGKRSVELFHNRNLIRLILKIKSSLS